MSESNKKTSLSIFDNQDSNSLKEHQRLEELKRQAKVQQVKLDKRLNKQKILMGAFLGQVLVDEGDDEKFIQNYFAMNFPDFLMRKSDKELFKSMIESLGGNIELGEEENPFVTTTKQRDDEANAKSVSSEAVGRMNMNSENYESVHNQQSHPHTATHYGEQDSLLEDSVYTDNNER